MGFSWNKSILIFCFVGFFKGFCACGRWLTDYEFQFQSGTFTLAQIGEEIIPLTSIVLFAGCIVIAFLLAGEVLSQKVGIILGCVASLGGWIILLWFYTSIQWARVHQCLQALSFFTTEFLFLSFIYSYQDKSAHKDLTIYAHFFIYLGIFVCGLGTEIFTSTGVLKQNRVHLLTFGGTIGACLLSLFLTKIRREEGLSHLPVVRPIHSDFQYGPSNVFPDDGPYGKFNNQSHKSKFEDEKSFGQKVKESSKQARGSMRESYGSLMTLKMSLWFALEFGLVTQLDLYVESLWLEERKKDSLHNGAIQAIHAISSIIVGLLLCKMDSIWKRWESVLLGIATLCQGSFVIVMSQTRDLYLSYAMYILVIVLYQILVIVARFTIAQNVKMGREAQILGTNIFLGIVIQSLLMLLLPTSFVLRLHVRKHFLVLGLCILGLGVLLVLMSAFGWLYKEKIKKSSVVPNEQSPDSQNQEKF